MKRSMIKVVLATLVLTSMLFTGCGDKKNTNTSKEEKSTEAVDYKETTIRVGSLKGPTSMGLVNLMADNEAGTSTCAYDFTMYTSADEIVAEVVKGNLDIATVPSNVGAVLYQKTNKGVSVIDLNTLGVLSLVGSVDEIQDVKELENKTIYLTGKGTTPDYALQYLLNENHVENVTLEYKSEPTEVASLLANDSQAIGLLPQPFVTTAQMANSDLHIIYDLAKGWKDTAKYDMVTGITIVRNEFLEEHQTLVNEFLKEHQASVEYATDHLDETCERIEAQGIVKAPVAKNAYPNCNIVCVTGNEMREALESYLNILYEYNATSVGGELPDDGFYYISEK